MPIITISSDEYDSDLLSNQAKSLIVELAVLESYFSCLEEILEEAQQKRCPLSRRTLESIEEAKIS